MGFSYRVVDDSAPDIEIFYQFCMEQGLIRLDVPDDTEEFILVTCDTYNFLKTMQVVVDKYVKILMENTTL